MEPNDRISSDAVEQATGRNWDEWFELLDEVGAKDMGHKDIADMLYNKDLINNPWWCQMVTNTYEKHIGRKLLGQSENGFQAGVRKIFPISLEKAWNIITSIEGRKIWLGTDDDFDWEKGETFRSDNGARGEVRIVNPEVNIRINWRKPEWQKYSTVQIRVIPNGDKTTISFHHENLPNAETREEMMQVWSEVLNKLELLI